MAVSLLLMFGQNELAMNASPRSFRAARFFIGPLQLFKERFMTIHRRPALSIFVDRSSQQWVVRDPDGNFWVVPYDDNPWDHRQPFEFTEKIELEPVPGHYKSMLRLPF